MKKIVSLLLVMVVFLSFSPAVQSLALRAITHTHYICSRDGGYELVMCYSHSHYCTKNGRNDWWPCIVYDKYKITERYCVDCGMVIDSLCYKEYMGQVHELAY